MSFQAELAFSGLTMAGGVFAAIAMSYVLGKQHAKRKEEEYEFVSTIITALNNGTLSELEDVISVYRAVRGIGPAASVTKRYLIQWLEKATLKIHKSGPFKEREKDSVLQNLSFLKNCISKLSEMEPFADLPETERNLMSDVLSFGKEGQEKLFINKLHDLGGVIKTRYEENNKLRETTKWSVPLSVIGIIVSIGFGLYTIFSS